MPETYRHTDIQTYRFHRYIVVRYLQVIIQSKHFLFKVHFLQLNIQSKLLVIYLRLHPLVKLAFVERNRNEFSPGSILFFVLVSTFETSLYFGSGISTFYNLKHKIHCESSLCRSSKSTNCCCTIKGIL